VPVRRIPKNYRNVTGVVCRGTKKTVGFESTLERDCYLWLDSNRDIENFEEQPVTIRFDTDGKQRSYTPDVLVFYSDKKRKPLLGEIKYHQDLRENWLEYLPKFTAAMRYAVRRGWRFRLITEKQIRSPYLENIKFLRRYSLGPSVNEHIMDDLIGIVKDRALTTPRDLLSSNIGESYQKGAAQYALWQLISKKTIRTDLSMPLTMDSKLWLGDHNIE